MRNPDLFTAVAKKTGEDLPETRRHGFVLTGPDETGSGPQPEPECLLDMLLVDLPENGTVDWDASGVLPSRASRPPSSRPSRARAPPPPRS